MSAFVVLDPSLKDVDLDGVTDENGIQYIGKATRDAATGEWTCVANVGGSLCLVVVTLTPQAPIEPSLGHRVTGTAAATEPSPWAEAPKRAAWPNDKIPSTQTEALLALAVFARTAPGALPERITASLRIADGVVALPTDNILFDKDKVFAAAQRLEAEPALPEPEPLHVGTADAPQVAAAKILRREALLLTPAIAAATLAKDSKSAEALLREQADALTKIVDLLAPKVPR